MSIANSIYHFNTIFNCFKKLNLGLFLSDIYLNHLATIIFSVFLNGFKGKTVDFAKIGTCHRTTIVHLLNYEKWNSSKLQDVLKDSVLCTIYHEATIFGKPVFCIVVSDT